MSASETTAGTTAESAAVRDVVPFRTAVRTWFAISLQTFGGPAGQIAVMQRALVEEKRWIGQQRFNHALSYCMLLPGPEAQQLAIYVGWLLNGTRGGLAAGTLFVLPGVVALLALSALYVAFGTTAAVTGLFAGLAPAVVVIVAQAVWRVGRRSLTHPALIALAVASFAALALFAVPFPLVVAVAALIGWLLARLAPQTLRPAAAHTADDGPPPLIADDALHAERPSRHRALRILGLGLLLWGAPLAAVAVLRAKPASPSPSESRPASPSPTPTETEPESSPAAQAEAKEDGGGLSTGAWIGIGAAVLIVAGGAAYVVRRRAGAQQ
ncbi:hypothetical protein SVIOM74S_04184 [Streptomyces violarus]